MSQSASDVGFRNELPILSRRYPERQLIVVADDVTEAAGSLARQIGATAKKGGAVVSRDAADKRANTVIHQTVLQIAAASVIPAHVNWAFTATLLGIGVVRIGRVYGVTLSRKEAWKLIKQFLKAAGLWFVSVYVGSKVFAAMFETTGIGYVAGAAIDVTVSSSIAYAIGLTAKAYFRGEHTNAELGEIMRKAFKEGKQQLSAEHLKKMREEEKATLFDYGKLREILVSEAGQDVMRRILLENAEVDTTLSAYMSQNGLTQLQDLTIEHLKALDDQAGLAHEIWELVGHEVDIGDSLEASDIDTVAASATSAPLQLWVREVSVLVVHSSDAEDLAFPFGHPRNGLLYAGHPVVANIYYPTAEFHRLVFEHKFSEAVRILRFLGATQFKVEHMKGMSAEWFSKFDVGSTRGQVGGEMASSQQSEAHILYQASFPGTQNPALPGDLAWYQHEPTWKEIVEGRLEHDLQEFGLDIKYTDDFGINAALIGKLAGPHGSLDLGGNFEQHESTIWRIVGTFGRAVR